MISVGCAMSRVRLLPAVLAFSCCSLVFAQTHHHSAPAGQVGSVVFPVSCSPAAQQAFPRAVALLHSFGYEQALPAFTAIAKKDPACAMAYWGEAMTYWRPLWYLPGSDDLKDGRAAIEKARALDAKTERERGFIQALSTFYGSADGFDYRQRALTYQELMGQLHRRYPSDTEVGAFYALALLDTSFPPDKDFSRQHQAAAILEPIFAAQPNHPGAAHYIIHSFDSPALAPDALKAARAYANIAPAVPHALHMPSHIFTRLGLWDDSIRSNLATEAAAKREAQGMHLDEVLPEQLHAMDYLMYAYLQSGRDQQAYAVLQELNGISKAQASFTAWYAVSAIPARYSMEREQWAEAAALEPGRTEDPVGLAITYWARAMGAAHTGDESGAEKNIAELRRLHDQLAKNQQGYDWATQVQIQEQEAQSWLAQARHQDEQALRLARAAADLEDSTLKHPVTPGAVRPARELLGEMLLALGKPQEALAEFETQLRATPERFRSLYGAARAGELSGNRQKAGAYYARLMQNCARAGTDRPELQEAKLFAAQNSGAQR